MRNSEYTCAELLADPAERALKTALTVDLRYVRLALGKVISTCVVHRVGALPGEIRYE